MPSITQDLRFTAGQSRVSTSSVLTTGDNWTRRPWLVCELLAERAGPEIDEAVLRWDYGLFSARERPIWATDTDDTPFEAEQIVTPLDLNQHYCKIEILDGDGAVQKTWYGVIELGEEETALTELDLESGTQIFRAFGLLRLLEQEVIASSRVLNSDGQEPFTIGRGLTFNGDDFGAFPVRGNRSFFEVGDVFLFTHEPRDQDLWDGSTALAYLLEHNAPTNGDGSPAGTWELVVGSANILDWFDITVRTERRSVKAVLDEICDRRRMLGYRVYGEETGGNLVVKVEVFTFLESDLSLPDRGKTIGANANQIELDFQSSPLVRQSRIFTTTVHAADVVIAEGEYVTTTATFDGNDWEDGWTSDQEDDYLDGDAGSADMHANTVARTRDELADVFSRFVIRDDWNQLQGPNASGGGEFYFFVIPYEDLPFTINDADVDALFINDTASAGPWWFRGKRFLRRLPLTDANSGEFRTPFLMFRDSASTPSKYVHAEHASAGVQGLRNFNVRLELLDDSLGFRGKVSLPGGQQLMHSNGVANWDSDAAATPPHLHPLAAENFALSTASSAMFLTAAVEWDERVRYAHVVNADLAAGRHQRVRRIFVPESRLDFELPQTITELDTDGTVIESTGRVLRDDRPRLKEIATAAAQWYGVTRNAIEVTYGDITKFVDLGQLVTEADGNTVNTVVTAITYNLARQETSLSTSYVEADFV